MLLGHGGGSDAESGCPGIYTSWLLFSINGMAHGNYVSADQSWRFILAFAASGAEDQPMVFFQGCLSIGSRGRDVLPRCGAARVFE
jgi:hypothetical protein